MSVRSASARSLADHDNAGASPHGPATTTPQALPAVKEDSAMASKKIIATGLGVGMLVGGVAGFAVTLPTGAFAQDADTGAPSTEHWAEHRAEHRAEHGGGKGEHEGMRGQRGPGSPGGRGGMPLEAAANAIGITDEDLRAQLRDGQSLAAIAGANGVDTDTLIDAITAEARIRITDMVNRVPGERMAERDSASGSGD